jgi:ATP-binding cassette, subfamily B, multidrug efflux pump
VAVVKAFGREAYERERYEAANEELYGQSLRVLWGMSATMPLIFLAGSLGNLAVVWYGGSLVISGEMSVGSLVAFTTTFIRKLPDGYRHPVGERGGNLSQGQRQLLAFARAVLHDPLILVLDEATASVDTLTERVLQQSLERIMQGRTTVVIAHRLSTVRRAHQILVIDQGRIVERGTHEGLLASEDKYADLYRRQFRPESKEQRI